MTMKNLLFVLLIFFTGNAFSQDLKCSQFKNGKFMIVDAEAGNSYITRNGNLQTETGDGSELELLFDVVWLDECTYTLKVKEILNNPNNIPIPMEMVLTVEIVEVKENSYIQISTSDMFEMELESEMFLIEK